VGRSNLAYIPESAGRRVWPHIKYMPPSGTDFLKWNSTLSSWQLEVEDAKRRSKDYSLGSDLREYWENRANDLKDTIDYAKQYSEQAQRGYYKCTLCNDYWSFFEFPACPTCRIIHPKEFYRDAYL
jgi:hypothetical protein